MVKIAFRNTEGYFILAQVHAGGSGRNFCKEIAKNF